MGLETVTYVSDLVTTNPTVSDGVSQGDDHLRNIKTALQNTFPDGSKPLYFPKASTKTANFTITAAQEKTTFRIDTTAGAFTGTLPALTSAEAGWECYFVKTTTDTSAYFIAPASGTLNSGSLALATTRRCIPGVLVTAHWTGTAWYISRASNLPVGTIIDYAGATLPVGYEWANGVALSSAVLYPDYFGALGALTVVDVCGRVIAGQDDMGGILSKNRLTGLTGGVNGDTFGAAGGDESHVLTQAQLPVVNLSSTNLAAVSTINPSTDILTYGGTFQDVQAVGGKTAFQSSPTKITPVVTTTISGTVPLGGSGTEHNNVQPTIILNKLVVVE